MTPDAYCAERGPAAGSSTYYAVQFARNRGQALALFALLRDLHAIVASVSDPAVANAKLSWWQAELGALGSGEVSHPITKALQQHGFADPAARDALLRTTLAIETDLTQTRFLDEVQLNAYCSAAGGAPLKALAAASGINEAATFLAIEGLGGAIARARLLLRVGQDGRRGRIYLPHESLRRFQVPASEILAGTQSERLVALVRDEADRTSEAIGQAIQALRGHRRVLRGARVLGRLNMALLTAAKDDGFQVAVHRVSLTPLRKFLIASRMALFS